MSSFYFAMLVMRDVELWDPKGIVLTEFDPLNNELYLIGPILEVIIAIAPQARLHFFRLDFALV